VQYPPFHLRGGDWQEAREGFGDRVQATLAAVSPGLVGKIRRRRVLTPADLADRFGLREGCIYQVEPALDQALFMRPMPRWYRHQTPIAGLYLGGPACHGGYGISGLAGRNAAQVIRANTRHP
jgi:phytoene dehydrogenase-like protein